MAAAGYRKIRMYDIKSGHVNPIVNYEGVPKNVTNVGFVENGKWMYTAGEDTKVRIWDLRVRTPQCQRLFPAGSGVNCVTLHPNQQEIIFGDQNGVIYLWNLGTDQNEQLVSVKNAYKYYNIFPTFEKVFLLDNYFLKKKGQM